MKNTEELKNALGHAKAGDEIILAEGEYVYSGATPKGYMFTSSADGTEENPINNFKIINKELEKYSEKLSKLFQIVAINKIDAIEPERLEELKKELKEREKQFQNTQSLKQKAVSINKEHI